jgi:hypothetical protein
MITETIETEIWENIPEKQGYVRHIGMVKIEDVFKQVKEKLPKKLLEKMDYFHISYNMKNDDIPYGRWISAYPVIGDNEGHYIHVDVISITDYKTGKYIGDRETIFLGKTFCGFDIAAQMAIEISRLFNDYSYNGNKTEIYSRYIITKE